MSEHRKVFVSYPHSHGEWVWHSLVPLLKAAGEKKKLELLIDVEHFEVGNSVLGSADALQDQADTTLAVLTPDYLKSEYCMYELERAVSLNPSFSAGTDKHQLLPLLRLPDAMPDLLKQKNPPIWCDLCDDGDDDAWGQLLRALGLGACLGVSPAKWLRGSREVVQVYGKETKSVNLVISKEKFDLRKMFSTVLEERLGRIGIVDLYDPRTTTLRGLYRRILAETGGDPGPLPRDDDLYEIFGERLDSLAEARLAILNFELVKARQDQYGIDLWTTLRFATENRKVVLMAHSDSPASLLMPRTHPVSEIDFYKIEIG